MACCLRSPAYHVIAPETDAAAMNQKYRSSKLRLRAPEVLELPVPLGHRISTQDCTEQMRVGVKMHPIGPRALRSMATLKTPQNASVATTAVNKPSRSELEVDVSAEKQRSAADIV